MILDKSFIIHILTIYQSDEKFLPLSSYSPRAVPLDICSCISSSICRDRSFFIIRSGICWCDGSGIFEPSGKLKWKMGRSYSSVNASLLACEMVLKACSLRVSTV